MITLAISYTMLRVHTNSRLLQHNASRLAEVASGNMGVSQRTGQSVLEMTANSLPVTIELAILATILGLLIGASPAELNPRTLPVGPSRPRRSDRRSARRRRMRAAARRLDRVH